MGEWERRNLPQTQFNYLVVVARKSASQSRRRQAENNVPANVIFPGHHLEVSMYDVRHFDPFVTKTDLLCVSAYVYNSIIILHPSPVDVTYGRHHHKNSGAPSASRSVSRSQRQK